MFIIIKMFFNKKLLIQLFITLGFYLLFVFIFSKLNFFKDEKNNTKVDWIKVFLFALLPAGIVFYFSMSFVDNKGVFHFSGVDENNNLSPKKFINESYNQN